MYCRYCGKQIEDNAVTCPDCGKATGVEEIKKTDTADFNEVFEAQETTIEQPPHEELHPVTNDMALIGFVTSFVSPLLGWVFGGVGLARSLKRKGKGKGFSIAAIAIASGMFLLNCFTACSSLLMYY